MYIKYYIYIYRLNYSVMRNFPLTKHTTCCLIIIEMYNLYYNIYKIFVDIYTMEVYAK